MQIRKSRKYNFLRSQNEGQRGKGLEVSPGQNQQKVIFQQKQMWTRGENFLQKVLGSKKSKTRGSGVLLCGPELKMSAHEIKQKPCYQKGFTLNEALKLQEFRATEAILMHICKLYKKARVSMPFSERSSSMHRWILAPVEVNA